MTPTRLPWLCLVLIALVLFFVTETSGRPQHPLQPRQQTKRIPPRQATRAGILARRERRQQTQHRRQTDPFTCGTLVVPADGGRYYFKAYSSSYNAAVGRYTVYDTQTQPGIAYTQLDPAQSLIYSFTRSCNPYIRATNETLIVARANVAGSILRGVADSQRGLLVCSTNLATEGFTELTCPDSTGRIFRVGSSTPDWRFAAANRFESLRVAVEAAT